MIKPAILFFAVFMMASIAFAQKKTARINHIAISVIDVKKSYAFYHDVIGLDSIAEPFHDGRHTWLSMGANTQLHIVQNPPPITVPVKNIHICFSVADLNGFIGMLQQKKIHYEDWTGKPSSITTRPDGVHQIYFQDPDGYWIEMNDDNK